MWPKSPWFPYDLPDLVRLEARDRVNPNGLAVLIGDRSIRRDRPGQQKVLFHRRYSCHFRLYHSQRLEVKGFCVDPQEIGRTPEGEAPPYPPHQKGAPKGEHPLATAWGQLQGV